MLGIQALIMVTHLLSLNQGEMKLTFHRRYRAHGLDLPFVLVALSFASRTDEFTSPKSARKRVSSSDSDLTLPSRDSVG